MKKKIKVEIFFRKKLKKKKKLRNYLFFEFPYFLTVKKLKKKTRKIIFFRKIFSLKNLPSSEYPCAQTDRFEDLLYRSHSKV